MALEYAPCGLLGVLTPQANTTVEPEMALLLPPGMAMLNARLVSDKPAMVARLLDYLRDLPAAAGQFANAPLGAIAFACTGASYFAGPAEEDALVARLEDARGIPVVTAARAVSDAFRALGARRIGLVSPYPEDLTAAAIAYWTARGFQVAAVSRGAMADQAFHPIYAMDGAGAAAALAALDGAVRDPAGLDAVAMLGTGMPTLRPIAERPFLGRAPVTSCMHALAWRSAAALAGRAPDAADLLAWVRGEGSSQGWGDRYRASQAASAALKASGAS
jgi:maleate cis-trans isomerase